MILQALVGYYERKRSDDPKKMPPFGYSVENIHYALEINKEGKFLQLQDLRRHPEKGKPTPKPMAVPTTTETASRSANVAPNFLWDNSGYVLGSKNKVGDKEKYFNEFKAKAHEIGDSSDDVGMVAVLKFLDNWKFERISDFEDWEDMKTGNFVFRLDGELQFVHEHPAVKKLWEEYLPETEIEYNAIKDGSKKGEKVKGQCLLTGETDQPIARVHRQLSGVDGGNPTGQGIISFNKEAFKGFGLEQSFNSPISIESAFKYTTALNFLLKRENGQRVKIGDATTVFWAGENSPVEDDFKQLVDPGTEIEAHIKNFLGAIREGKMPVELEDEKDKQFFILGLSPNASRISVRFWYPSTVEDVFGKLGEHYARLKIEKQYDKDFDFPGLWWLLKETATLGKSDNIPPLLAGELMRSILTGSRYPESLLSAVLSRIRADGHTNYNRASLTKAILIKNHNKEVTVSLNKENKEVPYLLGRLFAVLERAQEDAAGGQLNATIKDKYFGSASATPRAVFPLLLSLSSHHTKKGEHGGYYEKMTAEIMEDIPDEKFSASMPLEDQGLFFVGYYHQRNDFFKKKSDKTETTEE